MPSRDNKPIKRETAAAYCTCQLMIQLTSTANYTITSHEFFDFWGYRFLKLHLYDAHCFPSLAPNPAWLISRIASRFRQGLARGYTVSQQTCESAFTKQITKVPNKLSYEGVHFVDLFSASRLDGKTCRSSWLPDQRRRSRTGWSPKLRCVLITIIFALLNLHS